MTYSEDLALLLHDPATGRGLVDGTALPRVLAGAVVLELVAAGTARLTPGRWRTGLEVDHRARTGSPVHDVALARIPSRTTPKGAIERIGNRVRDPLLAGLAHDGAVRLEERRFLGVPLTPRWPAVDTRRRDALVGRMHAVLVGGVPPIEHDAALVALLRAVKAEHRVVAGDRRAMRAASKVVAEGAWAGEAVRRAVADVHAAVTAAVAAAGASASG